MSDNAAALPVAVTLPRRLLADAEAAPSAVAGYVEAQLSELMRDLGVRAKPVVQFEEHHADGGVHLIQVSVAGRGCRFPLTTVAEALAYVDGTPQVVMDTDAILGRLRAPDGVGIERLGELLALVCRAAVSAQTGVLLPATHDAGLRAAVDLGMSIAGQSSVARDPARGLGDPVELLIAALAPTTIDLHVEPLYLQLLTAQDPDGKLFPYLRDGLFVELGLPLPPFHLRPDPSLRPGGFAFRINAVRTLPRIGLSTGTILVNVIPDRLALLGIDAEPTLNPASHQTAALVSNDHKESLEGAGFTTWDPFGYFILSLSAAVRRCAHTLMTRDVAERMVRQLGQAFPALEEASRTHVPPDVLAPVLRELLVDGLSIRNLRRILELLLRYQTAGASDDRTDRITFVRSGLADAIASKAAGGTATVLTYLLDPELEEAIRHSSETTGETKGEDPLADRLTAAVRAELSLLPPTAKRPALLTRDELRRPIRALLRNEFPDMTVLAYRDLPPDFNVQPVARIS